MRELLPVVVAAALAACAGAPGAGQAGDPARLYRAKCSSCHEAYPPEGRTRAQWAAALPKMAPRAHLSGAERDRLGAWLQAHASDAPAQGAP